MTRMFLFSEVVRHNADNRVDTFRHVTYIYIAISDNM